jgi:hypothetical protein
MQPSHRGPAPENLLRALLIAVVACVGAAAAGAQPLVWSESDWSTGNYELANWMDGDAQPGILILKNNLADMRFLCDPADWQGINSMAVYHDSLFLAMSDHPFSYDGADIWTLDYRTQQFALSYQPYESGVLITKVFGDTLWVPGPDSMDPWYTFGSVYLYNGRQWIEKQTLPTAVHVCDVEVVNGILYASTGHATGALDGRGCVWISTDWGDSWTRVLTLLPTDANPVRRFFGLGHLGNRVFAQPDGYPPQSNQVYSTVNGVDWDSIPVPYMPIDKQATFTAWGDSLLMSMHNRMYIWDGVAMHRYTLPFEGWRWDHGYAKYKGDLYAGGLDCHIYKWVQGSEWTLVGPVGIDPDTEEIESMAVYCGRLYLGTSRRTLDQTGHLYISAALPNGTLVSLPHDFGGAITGGTLSWVDHRFPPDNLTRYRLRSGRTIEEMRSHSFAGPDGTLGTAYTEPGTAISSIHAGDRYFQYMAEMTCPGGLQAPYIESVTLQVWPDDPSAIAGADADDASAPRLVFRSPARVSEGMEMLIEAATAAPRLGGVQVQIRDAEGRVQRTARIDYASTGAARWRWDLRDAAGRPMTAGVYWVTAQPFGGAGAPVTRSLVVVP